MTRIDGADPEALADDIQRVLEAQARRWGAPLANHLLYARRAPIFRGARGMWAALDSSGLIDGGLQALVNRRVATLVGCPF